MTKYARAKGVLETTVEDELLLLSPSLEFFGLNDSAASIWSLFSEPTDLDSVTLGLVSEYDVDPEEARTATQAVIDHLTKAGLLVVYTE